MSRRQAWPHTPPRPEPVFSGSRPHSAIRPQTAARKGRGTIRTDPNTSGCIGIFSRKRPSASPPETTRDRQGLPYSVCCHVPRAEASTIGTGGQKIGGFFHLSTAVRKQRSKPAKSPLTTWRKRERFGLDGGTGGYMVHNSIGKRACPQEKGGTSLLPPSLREGAFPAWNTLPPRRRDRH